MNKTQPRIDVVMATYNGAQFIAEQIDSILNQSYKNVHLLIRDDNSQDQTRQIITNKLSQYPGKITIVPTAERLGVIGNFSALMSHSQAEYVMLSDQDDIWLQDKIEKTAAKMQELEAEFGHEYPLLVHTDARLVDADLKSIHDSFWEYSGLYSKKRHTFPRILMQNVVTGCTAMMNKKLVKLSSPIPSGVVMHDWWIAITAAAFGKIDAIHEPTMLYRQHGKNQVGAKKNSFFGAALRVVREPKEYLKNVYNVMQKQHRQAVLFLDIFRSKLSPAQIQTLEAFCQIQADNCFRNSYLICKHGFFKNGIWRNIPMLLGAHGILKSIVKPD